MPERLPRWVWVGAAALAAVAGFVNAVGFLGFEQQAITHLTGTTTLVGTALATGQFAHARGLASMLLAFVAGAVLSGLIIQDSTLRMDRRYAVALSIEAALLAAAVPLFRMHHAAGPMMAAVACGLQNAMATTFSGAVVRTSHVSGMFTDLGVMLGHRLRGLPVHRLRWVLSVLIIGFFFAGSLVGAWMFLRLGYAALYLPAALTGAAGAGYAAYRHLLGHAPA